MRRRKTITLLLLLLTLAQGIIFLFRDRFRYHPNVDVHRIYDKDIDRWKAFADDNAADLPAARRIADSAIGNEKGTAERAMAIARFLHRHFYGRLGQPQANVLEAAPLAQYRLLRGNDSLQLWCGNFAAMFALFCWSEGIACRTLEIMRPGDHHVLNEFFHPETGRWVAVDLTHNVNMASIGRITNPLLFREKDLRHFVEHNFSFDAWKFRNDSLVLEEPSASERQELRRYYNRAYPVYFYYHTNNSRAYGPVNKVKGYFLPVSWYEILSDEPEGNTLFYVKEFLALSWLLALLAWLAAKIKL